MAQTKSEYDKTYYQRHKQQKKESCAAYTQTARGREVRKRINDKRATTPRGRAQTLFFSAKKRAINKSLDFDLSIDWCEDRVAAGCELSGLPFVLQPGKRTGLAPSIDKIDPTGGYTQDNCRVILWALNAFKGTDTDKDMLRISRALVRHQEEV